MTRFRISQLAEERGLTMTELHRLIIKKAPADRPDLARITYRTVQRVAANKTKAPAYDTLEGIALALDVEIRDLYATSEDSIKGGKPEESPQGHEQKKLEPLCA